MIKVATFLLCELLLCILGMFTRKSKSVFMMIAIFMWFYIAFTFDSSDISNYRYTYINNIYREKDPLFYFLQNIFISLGCSFNVFKIILESIMALLFFRTLGKCKDCMSALAALCMFIPCGSFASQIRSGLAGIIVLMAIFLLTSDTRFKITKYLLLVGVASYIHQIALVYFVLLLPYAIKDKKRYIQFIRIIVIILSVNLIVAPTLINVAINLLYKFNNAYVKVLAFRLSQMFSAKFKATTVGFIFNAVHHFSVYFCADYSQKKELELIDKFISSKDKDIILIERIINNTLLLLVPLYLISFHFVRAFYYVVPFIYAIMLDSIFKVRRFLKIRAYGRNRITIVLVITLFVFAWSIIQEPVDFLRIVDGMFAWGK